MKKLIHKLSAPSCPHRWALAGIVTEEWRPNELHPHPRAAESGVKIQRKFHAEVSICPDCQKVLHFNLGYDQRDAQKVLAAPGPRVLLPPEPDVDEEEDDVRGQNRE